MPGRGLRSNELGPAMRKFGIRYKLIGIFSFTTFGGRFAATPLTLVVVPVLYRLFSR